MIAIGEQLKQARLAKGLTLEDVEAETKIRVRYLKAIEEGREDLLPGEVYVKGFIRAYAECVGLPGRDLVEQYKLLKKSNGASDSQSKEAVGGRSTGTAAAELRRRSRARGRPKWPTRRASAYQLVGIVAVGIVLIALISWLILAPPAWVGQEGLSETQVPPSSSGNARTVEAYQGSASRDSDLPPQEKPSPPEPEVITVLNSAVNAEYLLKGAPLNVRVQATGACWVRVKADGIILVEETLREGDLRYWSAKKELYIRAGNPGFLKLTVSGIELGTAGQPGIPKDILIRTEE